MLKVALFFFIMSSCPPSSAYNTGWDKLDRFMNRQHKKYHRKENKRIRKEGRQKYER
jgi:hypothetical protein